MSNAESTGVHRLVDMVVEEVSLVDRAANKHRFLVVKRDEQMDDKTEEEPDKKKPKPARKGEGDALSVATSALEALTSAVEQLGQAGDVDSSPLVAGLAEQLAQVASELAQSAGIESEISPSGELSEVVEQVRELLSQVVGILASSTEKAKPESPAVQDSSPELAKALSDLGAAVREQGQRLARLEKSFGLPNSRPAVERTDARAEPEAIGWPLDMNKPLDRESVDKSVSFHTL